MTNETDQLAQRRSNMVEVGRLGRKLYPNSFPCSDTIAELVDRHAQQSGDALEDAKPNTTTAGRILSIRSFGKANFLVLSDGRVRIQVYVRKDGLSADDFALFKLLDFGDLIGIEGRLFRTRTDELTICLLYTSPSPRD